MAFRNLILVVEDHPSNLMLVRDLLESEGFDVLAAENVSDACGLLDAHTPALALIDIQIPGGGGERVLAHMRGVERLAGIPAIAVTAYALKGDRERFLALDFDDYVSKPIDVTSFLGVVHSYASPLEAASK